MKNSRGEEKDRKGMKNGRGEQEERKGRVGGGSWGEGNAL